MFSVIPETHHRINLQGKHMKQLNISFWQLPSSGGQSWRHLFTEPELSSWLQCSVGSFWESIIPFQKILATSAQRVSDRITFATSQRVIILHNVIGYYQCNILVLGRDEEDLSLLAMLRDHFTQHSSNQRLYLFLAGAEGTPSRKISSSTSDQHYV